MGDINEQLKNLFEYEIEFLFDNRVSIEEGFFKPKKYGKMYTRAVKLIEEATSLSIDERREFNRMVREIDEKNRAEAKLIGEVSNEYFSSGEVLFTLEEIYNKTKEDDE